MSLISVYILPKNWLNIVSHKYQLLASVCFVLFKKMFIFFLFCHQVDSRDWALNGNTISLDEDTVIDVPQPFDAVKRYCASLGHKANHSFTPNCRYDP